MSFIDEFRKKMIYGQSYNAVNNPKIVLHPKSELLDKFIKTQHDSVKNRVSDAGFFFNQEFADKLEDRLSKAVIYGTSHPEMYDLPAISVAEKVDEIITKRRNAFIAGRTFVGVDMASGKDKTVIGHFYRQVDPEPERYPEIQTETPEELEAFNAIMKKQGNNQ